MKTALLILAFNEEKFIENVIKKYIDIFNEVIIIDDCSIDNTKLIVEGLKESNKNLTLISNEKNMGAGKSLEIGINYFLKSNNEYLIKIDGDDQFSKKDVLFLYKLLEKEHYDFIKCDRFWHDGIVGKIPTIRYFGNSLASLLIKFSTACWTINDPLNGLLVFSKNLLSDFKLPKLFNRYGYPFYVVTNSVKKSINSDIKIGQYRNEVRYNNENSNLNPVTMLFKLIWYTLQNYYSKILLKLRISEFQISALMDIISQILIILSFFSIYRIINIRYLSYDGPQGIWFMVFLIFLVLGLYLISISHKIEEKVTKTKITDIENI